jgi:hypothetical protein
MVMGERIKRSTRQATARVQQDSGTTIPDDEVTDAEGDAASATDSARTGRSAHAKESR